MTELRYGLHDRIEARLISSGLNVYDGGMGMADLGIGAKLALVAEQKGIIPQTSIRGDFYIPFGDSNTSWGGFYHNELFMTHHNLSDHTTLLTNIGPSVYPASNKTNIDMQYSIALGHAINDKWGIFTDVYGSWSIDSITGNPVSVDAGATYNVNDNVSTWASIALGLSESAPDINLGVGIAVGLL
ncbi:MAG: transporter [Candidatus Caenarcaniphilales bacterium]|jgi:hypothetical protein|nr:transporter [Candidatus Caenarcaniphilales bacterium]